MKKLVYNAIQTPDGTIIESKHRHDYVTHVDAITGNEYCVDGGHEYSRRSSWGDEKELYVYSDDPFEIVRQYTKRGSRGKDGKQPLTWIPLKDMTDEHLQAVLDYYPKGTDNWHLDLIRKEIQYRKENNISIKDAD